MLKYVTLSEPGVLFPYALLSCWVLTYFLNVHPFDGVLFSALNKESLVMNSDFGPHIYVNSGLLSIPHEAFIKYRYTTLQIYKTNFECSTEIMAYEMSCDHALATSYHILINWCNLLQSYHDHLDNCFHLCC